MRWVFGLAVVTALALLWSLWGRDWLKSRGWAWSDAFFAWVEPIEIKLWKNSKTIFKARLLMVVGALTTALTQAGAIDITPLMPFVPDEWEPTVKVLWGMLPMTITLFGWIDEQLRKDTKLPLDVVALPEQKPPEVAAVVEKLEATNAAAVTAVQVAKAEGVV